MRGLLYNILIYEYLTGCKWHLFCSSRLASRFYQFLTRIFCKCFILKSNISYKDVEIKILSKSISIDQIPDGCVIDCLCRKSLRLLWQSFYKNAEYKLNFEYLISQPGTWDVGQMKEASVGLFSLVNKKRRQESSMAG